jgi:hypothetical protein
MIYGSVLPLNIPESSLTEPADRYSDTGCNDDLSSMPHEVFLRVP